MNSWVRQHLPFQKWEVLTLRYGGKIRYTSSRSDAGRGEGPSPKDTVSKHYDDPILGRARFEKIRKRDIKLKSEE